MVTFKNRFNEFQRGHTSVLDKPRLAAPKTVTTVDRLSYFPDLAESGTKLLFVSKRENVTRRAEIVLV